MPDFLPAIMVEGHWRPAIGDPTPWGWAIVAGYYLACAACIRSAARARKVARAPRPWVALALVALLLGINKNFDFASWAWWNGRNFARDQGWYPFRAWVQVCLMIGVPLLVLGLTLLGLRSVRPAPPALYAAIAGAFVCMCLVAVRTLSFHPIDDILGAHIGGLTVSRGAELAGILILTLAALAAHRGMKAAQP